MSKNKVEKEEKKVIFTTKKIQETIDKMNDGVKLDRSENPYFAGEVGVRRANIVYEYSQEEIMEYFRCKEDVNHFAEMYCKIKREDGSIGEMKLRDYQKDILNLYTKNRYTILASSRQSGKCLAGEGSLKTREGDKTILSVYLDKHNPSDVLSIIKYKLKKIAVWLENN